MKYKETAQEELDQHFATLDEDQIGDQLQLKIDRYFDEIRNTGLLYLWKRSYNQFYVAVTQHRGILRNGGEQAEYTKQYVNHYRSLLQHKASLTIKDRPAFEPVATNTDHKSQTQTILAKGLLEYYAKDGGLETKLKRAVEFALRYGEGFVRVLWDSSAGGTAAVDPDSGEPVKEGDLEFETFSPVDVIRDTQVNSSDDNDWYIIRTFKNKWDIVAQYATVEGKVSSKIQTELDLLRESILAMPTKDKVSREQTTVADYQQATDLIPVYEFYHRKTPAVPNGRITKFLDAETILNDGDLPYKKMPIHELFASNVDGSPFGYTVAYDLLPLQEAVDGLHSAIITNQKTFAVQQIAIPRGSGLSTEVIGEGLACIFYDAQNVQGGGKPEAIQFMATAQEVFNYVKELEALMETLSGINSVNRGNPPANLKSGAALALVQSMAVDFASDFQNSYVRLLESVGTATIDILKTYAESERVAEIVGKNNRPMIQQFVGADMENINRVTVDVGNPLATTTAGKISILEGLVQAGLIGTPEQYLEVLTTGSLEAAIEGELSELMLIRSENEALSDGDASVSAIATDNHALHLKEHKSVLASPDARKDVNIVNAALAHIQEHINMLSSLDPNFLTALGQVPMAPQDPMQEAPQGAPMPEGGGGQGGTPAANGPPPEAAASMPNSAGIGGPSQPTNPLSGQEGSAGTSQGTIQ